MIPLPYKLIAIAAAFLSCTLGGYFFGHHVEALAFDAFKAKQAAVAAQATADAQAHARAAEESYATSMSAAQTSYQENLDALKKRRDALEAALSAGPQRVYVTASRPAAGSMPQASTGTSGTGETIPTALSFGSSKFFVDEFAEADRLASLVNYAEQVIEQDRNTCNGDAK